MAKDIENATKLDVIHIAKATGSEIVRRNVRKILLLGTKFTMEGDFYRKCLEDVGIEVVIPNEVDRQEVHTIIYKELILGEFKPESKKKYVDIINKHITDDGIDGVVLGCTEIPLLVKQDDVTIEVFDTTAIHCQTIVKYALS